MLTLFKYNWQVRDEWFDWCSRVRFEELTRTRVGGVGSILHTLFHVVDAEGSWIGALAGKPDPQPKFEDYMSVDKLSHLSREFRAEVKPSSKSGHPNWTTKQSAFTGIQVIFTPTEKLLVTLSRMRFIT